MMKNKFVVKGQTVEIEIVKTGKDAGKYTCLMDLADFERFQDHMDVTLCYHIKGYVMFRKVINGVREHFYLHRWVMNCPSDKVVDHKNWNRLDNTRENLRVCTQAQNVTHKRYSVNSHIRQSGGLWYVRFEKDGNLITAGKGFKTAVEAREIAQAMRAEHLGEFAGEVVQ